MEASFRSSIPKTAIVPCTPARSHNHGLYIMISGSEFMLPRSGYSIGFLRVVHGFPNHPGRTDRGSSGTFLPCRRSEATHNSTEACLELTAGIPSHERPLAVARPFQDNKLVSYLCICIYIYRCFNCTYIYKCMSMYVCEDMCAHVHIHMHVFIYKYTYMHTYIDKFFQH